MMKLPESRWFYRGVGFCIGLTLGLLILGQLGSCAGQTLEQMEAEATVTGDWSKVERVEERRAYDDAMKAATQHCRHNNSFGRAVLWCVDMPMRKKIKDIYRYCSCQTLR